MDSSKLPYIPFEIQEIILSFIPPNEMNNVKLVCKVYNSVCSQLQSFCCPLVISEHNLDDLSIVNSMKNTLRRFNSMHINVGSFSLEQHSRIVDILNTHGEWIQCLYLDRASYNCIHVSFSFKQSYVTKWLNLMPNLRHFSSAGFWAINDELDDEETPLNLPNIAIVRYPPDSVVRKLHLTPNASISYLNLCRIIEIKSIGEIFQKHASTLRELIFQTSYPSRDPKIFEQLQLHAFRLHCNARHHPSQDLLVAIIDTQKELRQLCIGQVMSSECIFALPRLLTSICNLKNLKELEMGLSDMVGRADIWKFARLTQLEKIFLEVQNSHQAEEFCQIPLPSILYLELNEAVSLKTLKDIGSSFPNLECLHVDLIKDENPSFNNFFDELPKLKELSLIESYYNFEPTELTYPSMNVLNLWCENGSIALSADFIRALPNLEEIQVELLVGNVETLEALLASKIKKIDIKMPFAQVSNVARLKKLKKKLAKKCLHCEINIIL